VVAALAARLLAVVAPLDWLVFGLAAVIFGVVTILIVISTMRLARRRAAQEGAPRSWWEREIVLVLLTALLTALVFGLALRDMLSATPA
jgi:heme/copper-type cytochrome/quinol oxidase subunit 2